MKKNKQEDGQPQKIINIMVVDDHPVFREGLRAMLRGSDIKIIADAASGEEALEKVGQQQPDVVLLDIRLPGISGLDVARQIKNMNPRVAIIMLTIYENDTYLREAFTAGASAYLLKDVTGEFLRQAIYIVDKGGTVVSGALLRHALGRMIRTDAGEGKGRIGIIGPEKLTTREMDVLRLMAKGDTNKEIARELSIAEITVKKHVQSVIYKLGMSTRTQAAIAANRLGLVE